ncbi:hypothetical protein [Pseudoalteromonas sp. SG44-17]|uniref:hypothetical protein n=1 Tax=Pseudoalteromonas sp. SG44-17 TaxID=2760963 RepID=UPI001600BDD2|nr:hypothetical protein [Pseudoalteromonas sp. SG44-17]MBB1409487.1 hypothetical protein [Pseudoalteromonas sp. SG44-17]
MNNAIKKVLPALLLATAFNTAFVIAAESKTLAIQSKSAQCMIGETITNAQPLNKQTTSSDAVTTSNINTQTLLSTIDEKIAADFDSSINKINSQIDKNLSRVTSSITAYITSVLTK